MTPVDTIVAERTKTRTPWARRWLEGAGISILLAPGVLWGELSSTNNYAFHRLLPFNTIDRALALDLVAGSLLAMLVAWGIEKIVDTGVARQRPGRRSYTPLLWTLWISFALEMGVLSLMQGWIIAWSWVSPIRTFGLAFAAGFILWAASARLYDRAIHFVRTGLMLAGLCLFWMVPLLIAHSLARQPWDATDFSRPVPVHDSNHPRIVWLLFDGMSYDQVFVHRWPDLAMPNFDRLRARSVTFSSVSPEGQFTENIVPSLLLGKTISKVVATRDGWPKYRAEGDWVPFEPNQTLFADAKRNGWTTGIVGFWNPYCRILKDQLDLCHMDLAPLAIGGMSRDNNTIENAMAPVYQLRRILFGPPAHESNSNPTFDEFTSIDRKLIMDKDLDLCFLHLAAPHPPGFYDRRTQKLGTGSHSYVDNLALADRLLGVLLDDLDRSGTADRTTLIISSDHSWRVWLWRNQVGWTDEDELASAHGKLDDPRPMLMVRFPHEQHASEISRPVPLLWMHGLLESMMAGQLESRQQLEDWAARQ